MLLKPTRWTLNVCIVWDFDVVIFISKYWMQNKMDFFLFLKFNLFRLITTMIVDWLACYLSALPASEVGHDYFELSLRFVVWVPKCSSKSRSHDCASLQGGGGGSTSVTAVAVERLLVRTPPWIYCLDSWFNQYSFTACFFHFLFVFWLYSIPSLPPLSLISNRINAIILWIPQDFFGEKNNKTPKNQINK